MVFLKYYTYYAYYIDQVSRHLPSTAHLFSCSASTLHVFETKRTPGSSDTPTNLLKSVAPLFRPFRPAVDVRRGPVQLVPISRTSWPLRRADIYTRCRLTVVVTPVQKSAPLTRLDSQPERLVLPHATPHRVSKRTIACITWWRCMWARSHGLLPPPPPLHAPPPAPPPADVTHDTCERTAQGIRVSEGDGSRNTVRKKKEEKTHQYLVLL